MKVKALFLFIFAVCLFQISFGQENSDAIQTPQGYLLGPGDIVSIRVLGEKEFEVEKATVDEDGKIQIPYSEGIMAKCKTEKELRADVVKIYSKYIRNPQVTILIERKSRPPVTISGEVRTPGQIELRRTARLLELISFSNGVTDDTNGMIQVFRTQPPMCSDASVQKEWKEASVNGLDVPSQMYSLTNLLQGRDEANPIIFPGDVIVVLKASPVYITGEVRQPVGLYLKEGGLSLTQAIAMVGGVNSESAKEIKIYRLKPNSKERETKVFNYKLIKKGEQKDPMLEPYDIVEVEKGKPNIAETILKMAIGIGKTVVTSGANSVGYRILY